MNFTYKGYGNSEGTCGIVKNGNVVVATERIGSTATSITNVAETLATEVANYFGINLKDLIWIEHYEEYDTHDLVSFKNIGNSLSEPSWRRITKDETKRILYSGRI